MRCLFATLERFKTSQRILKIKPKLEGIFPIALFARH
jgi:hypothetical protein